MLIASTMCPSSEREREREREREMSVPGILVACECRSILPWTPEPPVNGAAYQRNDLRWEKRKVEGGRKRCSEMENKHTKDRLPSRGRTPLSPALLPHSADPHASPLRCRGGEVCAKNTACQ